MKSILIENGITITEDEALEWIGKHLKGLSYEIKDDAPVEEPAAIPETEPEPMPEPEPEPEPETVNTAIVEPVQPQEPVAETPKTNKKRRDILGDL